MKAATLAVLMATALAFLAACDAVSNSAPECRANQRLALVAQSVPTASYVPCIASLPAGWRTEDFHAESGSTSFRLSSDRSAEPVDVDFRSSCRLGAATPIAPRAAGARTYIGLDSVAPHYAGTLYDVFPGGCVSYEFHFERPVHIGLMEDFQASVALFSRRELRLRLDRSTGVRLR